MNQASRVLVVKLEASKQVAWVSRRGNVGRTRGVGGERLELKPGLGRGVDTHSPSVRSPERVDGVLAQRSRLSHHVCNVSQNRLSG